MSLNGLGYLYFHGLGVEKDIVQARDFFEKAREEDKDNQNSDVLFNLGLVSLDRAWRGGEGGGGGGLPPSVVVLGWRCVCCGGVRGEGEIVVVSQQAWRWA